MRPSAPFAVAPRAGIAPAGGVRRATHAVSERAVACLRAGLQRLHLCPAQRFAYLLTYFKSVSHQFGSSGLLIDHPTCLPLTRPHPDMALRAALSVVSEYVPPDWAATLASSYGSVLRPCLACVRWAMSPILVWSQRTEWTPQRFCEGPLSWPAHEALCCPREVVEPKLPWCNGWPDGFSVLFCIVALPRRVQFGRRSARSALVVHLGGWHVLVLIPPLEELHPCGLVGPCPSNLCSPRLSWHNLGHGQEGGSETVHARRSCAFGARGGAVGRGGCSRLREWLSLVRDRIISASCRPSPASTAFEQQQPSFREREPKVSHSSGFSFFWVRRVRVTAWPRRTSRHFWFLFCSRPCLRGVPTRSSKWSALTRPAASASQPSSSPSSNHLNLPHRPPPPRHHRWQPPPCRQSARPRRCACMHRRNRRQGRPRSRRRLAKDRRDAEARALARRGKSSQLEYGECVGANVQKGQIRRGSCWRCKRAFNANCLLAYNTKKDRIVVLNRECACDEFSNHRGGGGCDASFLHDSSRSRVPLRTSHII